MQNSTYLFRRNTVDEAWLMVPGNSAIANTRKLVIPENRKSRNRWVSLLIYPKIAWLCFRAWCHSVWFVIAVKKPRLTGFAPQKCESLLQWGHYSGYSTTIRRDFPIAAQRRYTEYKHSYNMTAKYGEILDSHNIVYVLGVSLFNVGQNCHLHIRLLHDLCRFFHHLHRHLFSCFVVANSQNFSKWAFINGIQNLVTVGQVVSQLVLIELAVLWEFYSVSHLRDVLLQDYSN